MRAGFNILLLAGILISLTMLSNLGYAEVAPSKINTSIYVYNIRGFDVSTGQYDVDFYIHFKWNANDVPQNISDQVTSLLYERANR